MKKIRNIKIVGSTLKEGEETILYETAEELSRAMHTDSYGEVATEWWSECIDDYDDVRGVIINKKGCGLFYLEVNVGDKYEVVEDVSTEGMSAGDKFIKYGELLNRRDDLVDELSEVATKINELEEKLAKDIENED